MFPVKERKEFNIMKKGNLKIASIIQILLGVLSILAIQLLLKYGDVSAANMEGKEALKVLMIAYGGVAFQILAGIIGLILANKKSIITIILGVLLFIPQALNFNYLSGDIVYMIINAILLLIPYYYLYSAFMNYKQK